jgi:hypothetical protein
MVGKQSSIYILILRAALTSLGLVFESIQDILHPAIAEFSDRT